MFFAAVTRRTHVHPRVIMVYGTGGYYIGRSPNTFGWALSHYGTHAPYSKVVPFGRSKIRVFTTPGPLKAGFKRADQSGRRIEFKSEPGLAGSWP